MTLVAFLAGTSPSLCAQKASTSAKHQGGATLEGKVFAVTDGGDVKPALLGHVYLFHANAPIISQWLMSTIRAHDEFDARVKASAGRDPDSVSALSTDLADNSCREVLSAVDLMLPGHGPAYTADTDETGRFKIPRVKHGDYDVVVRGQAGRKDVLWVDKVAVSSGTKTVSLHSVAEACSKK